MKKLLLFFAMAVAAIAANATTYALYGTVPEGATDLTAKVVAEAQGTVTFAEGVLTGAGLPGRINETSNYLRLSFSEAQDLSLTEEFALHIVLQKADGVAGKVQVSLCNNGWNAARVAWEIENADIAADQASDVALKYADRNTGNWNSYGDANIVGDKTFTNEIMRISAASGEQFTITSIYLESAYQGGDDPVTPPTPEGNMRYYLYRGNNTDALPTIDDVTCVDVRPTANAAISTNSASVDANVTDYAQFTVNGSWCAIDHKPTAAVANNIDNTYYLVVRFKTDLADGAVTNNKLRFNLSSGAGNFYINNSDDVTYNDGKWHIVKLALAEANGNKPSTYLIANQHAFQIHLDGNGESGKIIAIDYAYFTNDVTVVDEGTAEDGEITPPEPEVIPEQAPQRIYLRKGSAVTPDGVAVTADYSEGAYLTCEWWNCAVSNEFFGITTSENWWFNMQLKNNADIDLTPVYSTWRLVIRLQNKAVEDGQDRGLTIELGSPAANVELVSTFAEAESFVVKELPLTESLTGAKHLNSLTAGANILVMSSGNNNVAGRTIEFDYIFFTNEPDPVDPGVGTGVANSTVLDRPVKFISNGRMFIRRGDVIYDLNGQQIR